MFQVQNQATYSQFQVKTRDELLFELDLLGARQKKKGEKAAFDVFYLDEAGRLQDKRSLTFPLEGTVDEALADFGQDKLKKLGFFKRLFSFKKKDKQTVSQVEAIPTNNESSSTEAETQEEMSVADLLTSTALAEEKMAHETTLQEEEFTEESEMSVEADSHDVDEEENDDSDSIFDHVASSASLDDEEEAVSGEENVPFEEAEEQSLPEEVEVEEQSPFEVNKEKQATLVENRSSSTILKVTESRDIESLTAIHQKQSFELQLQEEVDQIEELITRLTKQKEGHLKLLQYLQRFTTD